MTFVIQMILAAVVAQATPASPVDFSGIWTLDPARSEAVKRGGRIERGPIVITQNDTILQVAPVSGQTEVVTSVVAPDSEKTKPVEVPTSVWEGSTLVTTRDRTENNMAMTITQRRSLAQNGSEMIVDTAVTYHHGYKPGEQTPKTLSRDVYVRPAP